MKIQGMRGSSGHGGDRGSVGEHKSQENNLKLQIDSVQILARVLSTVVTGDELLNVSESRFPNHSG